MTVIAFHRIVAVLSVECRQILCDRRQRTYRMLSVQPPTVESLKMVEFVYGLVTSGTHVVVEINP